MTQSQAQLEKKLAKRNENREKIEKERSAILAEVWGEKWIQDKLYEITTREYKTPKPFDDDIFLSILDQISGGRSLHTILDEAKNNSTREDLGEEEKRAWARRPSIAMFFKWLKQDDSRYEQYTKAKDAQVDAFADHIVHLADTTTDPSKARLQIDVRKRIASKLKPKIYGDKLEVEGNVKISLSSLFEEAQKRLKQADIDVIDMEEEAS